MTKSPKSAPMPEPTPRMETPELDLLESFDDEIKDVDHEIATARHQLKARVRSLRDDLDYALVQMECDPNYAPNRCGLIQSNGLTIDTECAGFEPLFKRRRALLRAQRYALKVPALTAAVIKATGAAVDQALAANPTPQA